MAWTIAVAAPAGAQSSGLSAQNIDALFERFTAPGTPGCAVGVARDGRTIVERAYGAADLEHAATNTATTRFEAGSVSKQFTAAAILLLVEQGKLKLTDDVRRFVPELPDYGAIITIDSLLDHTSGLRDWDSLSIYSGLLRGQHAYSNAEILDMARHQRGLNHAPGEEFSYTNTGYSLSVLIIERLSGQSFADFTRTHIFAPLGMNATEWRTDFRRVVKNRAIAYQRVDGVYVQNMPFENAIGSGALITTVGDLLIWNTALTENRLGADLTRRLREAAKLKDGRTIAYARGLHIGRYRDVPEISHSGLTAGYRAWLAYYPEQRVSVALLCNAADSPVISIARAIADRLLPPARQQPASPVTVVDSQAKVGLFADVRWGFPMRLTLSDGRLRIGSKDLEPIAADRFRYADGEIVFRSPDAFTYFSPDGPALDYRRQTASSLSPADLARLAGRYFSEELGATYDLVVDDGTLILRRERWPDTAFRLVPLYQDAFEFDQSLVRVQRDADGRPSSLSIGDRGARDIRFVRFD